ncbi:MAG TPA: YceD family protein [Streptosporangiaceae bacterium]|nr:YceD family protein [Streptosporangiaceae bacterium]
MPHSRTKHLKRLDPRNPLVFDTRDLATGTARTLNRTCPAPGQMGMEMVRVPAGADLELDVQLEGVAEGVLVTASVTAPLVGECARCLEPFTSETQVRFQELFTQEPEELAEPGASPAEGEQSYLLDDSGLLDLEPALRDALVLELPLSPLCEDDCQGLCVQCGVRLADAEPGHGHEQQGGALWTALKDYQAREPEGSAAGDDARPDGKAGPEMTTDRTDSAPEQAKEH